MCCRFMVSGCRFVVFCRISRALLNLLLCFPEFLVVFCSICCCVLPNFSLCFSEFLVVFCSICCCVLFNLLLCFVQFIVVFCLSGPPYHILERKIWKYGAQSRSQSLRSCWSPPARHSYCTLFTPDHIVSRHPTPTKH